MRRSITAFLFTATLLATLPSAASATARSELRGVDAESSLRRTRRDAVWLRQASARPATSPAVLRAASSQEFADQLDSWLRRDRSPRPAEPAARPVETATHTPRR